MAMASDTRGIALSTDLCKDSFEWMAAIPGRTRVGRRLPEPCYWESRRGASTQQPEIKNRKWVSRVPLLGNDEMRWVSTLRCNHERLGSIKVAELDARASF